MFAISWEIIKTKTNERTIDVIVMFEYFVHLLNAFYYFMFISVVFFQTEFSAFPLLC
jgi:hypothetical protein